MKVALLLVFMLNFPGLIFCQDNERLIYWLTESSINISTTDPEQEIIDFPPDFFNGKNIILAGEATHGTSEFAQVKHRLFKYLVENYNFKYIMIEADFTTSLYIDRYVRDNIGDPKALLSELKSFHIANEDGLNLIKWMNQYNADKEDKDKLRFLGIDCQSSNNALNHLKEYFIEFNPNFYSRIKDYSLKTSSLKFGAETLGEDSIKIVENELQINKDYYIKISSHKNWKLMAKLTEILNHSLQINNSDGEGYSLREQYTADLAKWILNSDNDTFDNNDIKKGFIWAHNAHVCYTVITNRGTGKTRLS